VVNNEWAQNADDVLWRRSKIGLKATAEDCAAIDRFIGSLGGMAALTAR
jgi:glycerol-3-phosphate dehydrogenase